MNITILTGGSTPERDVALAGAGQVLTALRDGGHQVAVVDTTSGVLDPEAEQALLFAPVPTEPPDHTTLSRLAEHELGAGLVLVDEVRNADVVFPVLHGRDAEGGTLQAFLEGAGICYTGSDPLGSAIAMDKDIAKRLFTFASIPTPRWEMWPTPDARIADLGLPVVVKPSRVGSTVGLTVVQDRTDLSDAVALAQSFDDDVILEQFIGGTELTVGILGDEALTVGEIRPAHEIFDYECKYTAGMCEEIFPAPIDGALARRVQELGLMAHRALKLRDYSRVDFRISADGSPMCLEVNTLPGLTPTSLLPQSAAAAGIRFETLCERIVQAAVRRNLNPPGGN